MATNTPSSRLGGAVVALAASFMVLCGLSAQAQILYWEGRDGSDWHNTNNWDLYSVPTSTNGVLLNKGTTIVSSPAQASTVEVAYFGPNTLTLNSSLTTGFISVGRISGAGIVNLNTGGGLTVGSTGFFIGDNSGGIGTVNMSGGSATVDGNILLGVNTGATGTLNLSGGTISTDRIYLNEFGGSGSLFLTGGSITTDWLSFNPAFGGGLVQFTGATPGKMVITDALGSAATWLANVNGWISNGYIVNGQAAIVGNTIEITAVPEPSTLAMLALAAVAALLLRPTRHRMTPGRRARLLFPSIVGVCLAVGFPMPAAANEPMPILAEVSLTPFPPSLQVFPNSPGGPLILPTIAVGEEQIAPADLVLKNQPEVVEDGEGKTIKASYTTGGAWSGDRTLELTIRQPRGLPMVFVESRLVNSSPQPVHQYYYWSWTSFSPSTWALDGGAVRELGAPAEKWTTFDDNRILRFSEPAGEFVLVTDDVVGRGPVADYGDGAHLVYLHGDPKNRQLLPGDAFALSFVLVFGEDARSEAAGALLERFRSPEDGQ